MPADPAVTLVPFTPELLPAVQPWFLHPEVRRHLGGPDWPAREFTPQSAIDRSPDDNEYRGLRALRSHSWVALDSAGEPVAKAGGEIYDRWCRYDGSDPEHPVVTAVEPGPSFGFAYVVAPHRWRHGFGRATLRAVVDHPDLHDVRVFTAGIDVDNVASRRCAASAGFAPDVTEPDSEDIVYYLLRRKECRGQVVTPS